MEVYFCCLCFCTLPQPVFVFLAVHILQHLSHPSNYNTLLYSSDILDACIRTAAVLRKTNASADHNPNFITSRILYNKVKQDSTLRNREGSTVSAFKFLWEYSITPLLESFKLPFRNCGFCSWLFIIVFFIYMDLTSFFLFSHSCNCRIRQHLFCVLLRMYLMGDLITKSPWWCVGIAPSTRKWGLLR